MARSLKNMMGAGLGAESASLINGVVIDGLVATGSSQADALLLSSDVNVVGTVDTGTGVRLRATPQPGDECVVANLGANALNVYPALGGSIQGGAINAAYQLSIGSAASFVARSGSLNWAVLSSGGQGVVGPTLGALTFSATTFTVGTSSSGTIIGATATSTISASGLPTGLTINGTARTWAWDGTGTASSGSFTLTEVLAGATNTPLVSTVSYTINAAAGALSAPTVGYPSPLASNPTTVAVHVGPDWQTGDVLKLARSASVAMSSPTLLTHTLTDADIAAGTFSIGLSGVTLSGTTYFQAYGSHSGADSVNRSNIVTWGDTVAPTITTSATQSITETSPLAVALTGTDSGGIASWSIVGGADQLQFAISGSTLEWVGNGTQTYASPNDFGADNGYSVTVQATDYGGNTSTQAIAVSVTQIDQTPDAFTFTNVSGATLSTLYTSNTVTLSGLQAGFNINASVAGTGFTYSKNGGAYQAPGSFTVQNGDTITLRDTSASSNSVSNTATVTVGTYSTGWSVATPGSAATLTTGTGTTGAGTNRSHFVNATAYQMIMNAAASQTCLDRAIAPAANGKFLVEVTVNHLLNNIFCGFDDGTSALNTISTTSQLPGNASGGGAVPGICMQLNNGSFPIYTANGAANNYAGPATPFPSMTTGTVFTFAVDTTAKTVAMYINGTLFQTFTLTSQIPSSWYFLLGGTNGDATVANSDAATVNFGASAFTYPQTGYTYYA